MASEQGGQGSKEPNMEWMYKPSALVNRDDYLMGRSVDKSFHLLEAVEQGGDFNYAAEVEKDLTPMSIFAPTKSGPVDVIKKIKEDPLYQIQKKEEENLKEILKNPVKMKQIKQMNEAQERKRRLSETSSSKKKHKKHHHHRRRDSSSSSDSDSDNHSKVKEVKDIDRLISEKLKTLKKTSSSSYTASKLKDQHGHSSRSDSRQPSRFQPPAKSRKPLDEAELEKRRREMMDNAKWRDEQRTKNVTKYREAQKKEEEESKSGHNADFIRKQLLEAASTGSVEKRIKSNAYNIQKSSNSMNKNFARR